MQPSRLQRSNEKREYCRSCCCLLPWQRMWVPSHVSACIISLASHSHNRSGCGCGCGALIGAHRGGKYRGYSERSLLLCADCRNVNGNRSGCLLPRNIYSATRSSYLLPTQHLWVSSCSTSDNYDQVSPIPDLVSEDNYQRYVPLTLPFSPLIYYSVCSFLIFRIF